MTTILSPIDLGTTSKIGGRLFRKQILPVGSINYKGRTIDFTRDKLAAMADAFRDRAFDSVPLVFADHDNRHTMDPRQTTGEMVDMEVTADGLDGIFRASDEAAKLLDSYPKVGVSARILENYERADGKAFPAAIQHALITSDPRITGMRPWEAVNLSTDVEGDVLDLTAETYASPGVQKEAGMADKQSLTDDEVGQLRSLLALLDKQEQAEDTVDTAEPDEQSEPQAAAGDEQAEPGEPELSDDELEAIALEALAADEQAEQGEQGEQAPEREPIAAANDTAAVELANAQAEELRVELANMRRELDARTFERERDRFAHDYGIPPAITDLARPLLEGQQVIELSNGASVDAGKVMRDVFAALKQFTLLDLSAAVGSVFETDAEHAETAERDDFLKRFRAENKL